MQNDGYYRGRRLAEEDHSNKEIDESRGKRLQKENKVSKPRQFWNDFGYLLVTALAVVIVFRVFLQLAYVPTGSMETTIPAKSLLISWQLPYLVSDPIPQRGDVITFWDDELNEILVKRVIGLPGETVSFSNGYVYIDGEQLEENYLRDEMQGQTISTKQDSFTVPDGCLFVMGDNRTGSNDSRYLAQPYIPIEKMRAKVLVGISIGRQQSWQGVHIIQ